MKCSAQLVIKLAWDEGDGQRLFESWKPAVVSFNSVFLVDVGYGWVSNACGQSLER